MNRESASVIEWAKFLGRLRAALVVVENAHAASPTGEVAELYAVEETLRLEIAKACSAIDRLRGVDAA